MKKIGYIILLLALIPCIARAQNFKGGVLAGLVASQVDGDTYSGFNKAGAAGGFFVQTMLSRSSSATLEIKYMGKGAAKKTTELDPAVYKMSLHYIEIPVIYNLWLTRDISIDAGLAGGYLFAAKEEDGFSAYDPFPAFRPFEFSGLAGLTYAFLENVSGAIRYSYSIIPIREHASGQHYLLNRGQYNNLIEVNLRYTFH